jgi:hypothetical protein
MPTGEEVALPGMTRGLTASIATRLDDAVRGLRRGFGRGTK